MHTDDVDAFERYFNRLRKMKHDKNLQITL